MVGCDHVAQQRQNACTFDVCDNTWFLGHALEVGRVLNVCGRCRPVVCFSVCGFNRLPFFVAFEDVRVLGLERFACDGLFNQLSHFLRCGPDVFQEDVFAVSSLCDRIVGQIDVHCTCDGVGNDQRRGCQVVRTYVGRDTAFEVTVTGKNRCCHQIAFGNRFGDLFLKRAGVTDTCGTAVTNKVEANLVQIFLQASGLKVGGNNLRTRCQRCFDPRLAIQTQSRGFARHQTRADHDVGVGCVCAGCDRRDHDLAGFHRVVFASDGNFFAQRALEGFFHLFGECCLGVVQRNVVLRTLRTGDRRNDCAHIQVQRVCVDRCIVCTTPETVFFRVGFDQCDTVFFAACVTQVTQSFVVDREEATCRTVFRRHVRDCRAVGQRQTIQTFAVEFNELANNALGAQHFNDFQNKVGTCGAFDHRTCQFKADNLGDQHRNRLTQHRRFGFDTANTPAQYGRAVDHGCVAVCTNQRIRIGNCFAVLVSVCPNGLRQVFKVYLVTDTCARGNNAEIVERVLAPLKECVTLEVTFVFAVNVHLERARVAEFVDHNRVVDNQINGVQRVNLLCVATQRLDAVAHRSKVNNRRNAGEVLHQNAGRAVCDFTCSFTAVRGPVGKRLDVVDGNGFAVFETQKVFQNHFQSGGQFRKITKSRFLSCWDRVIGDTLSAGRQRLTRLGGILAYCDGHELPPGLGWMVLAWMLSASSWRCVQEGEW